MAPSVSGTLNFKCLRRKPGRGSKLELALNRAVNDWWNKEDENAWVNKNSSRTNRFHIALPPGLDKGIPSGSRSSKSQHDF